MAKLPGSVISTDELPEAYIFREAPSPMQHGLARTHEWVVEFAPWSADEIEPLMGWTASRDPLTSLSRLRFPDRESAVAFAERQGWHYLVRPAPTPHFRPKSYADNFRGPFAEAIAGAWGEPELSSSTRQPSRRRDRTNSQELDSGQGDGRGDQDTSVWARGGERPAAVGAANSSGDIMRSDEDIKRDVEAELRWDPDIGPTDIAVAVSDGVATLTGFVRSYNEKLEAESAAKRVSGLVGVANDIEVRLPSVDERPDPEIAREAVAAIRNELPITGERIKVLVRRGVITLEGEVEWNYQREEAQNAVRSIKGVKSVINQIQLKPRAAPSDIKRKIEEAFRRSAELEANQILVEANGSEVVLKGTVRSWAERQEAERAAWSAPGVTRVDNRIVIAS